MGHKFKFWQSRSSLNPKDFPSISKIVLENRKFNPVPKLHYGDHGLEDAFLTIKEAVENNRRIALYADYDVDGTMSCVSWVWFFEGIGFKNYTYYIPNRFKEGYGVNLAAVKYLAESDKAEVIITMDTGITANAEAQWCKENGVRFICTDHHKIQPDKMPDCIILNPKLHPDPDYQELCGCGVTFVLLRKLGQVFNPSEEVWLDILALVGMATICDVVPLNGVNHKLVQQGVSALLRSKRPVLVELMKASALLGSAMDERDIGFRLGPRINAVGRLEHAEKVVEAFIHNNPKPLIDFMGLCNERRKTIQTRIVEEAREQARAFPDAPILFLGGPWHQGVVGIAASKLAEEFWKPVWLFDNSADVFKGSARSIPGFDVTDAMMCAKDSFVKFGGHRAAGGFSFLPEHEAEIRMALNNYAMSEKTKYPEKWESTIHYDCELPIELADLDLNSHLSSLRPFGHGFEEPLFCIEAKVRDIAFYPVKSPEKPQHTAVTIQGARGQLQKIMFFNQVHKTLRVEERARFLVSLSQNVWQGKTSLSLMGEDFDLL